MNYSISDIPPSPEELAKLYMQAGFIKEVDEVKMKKTVKSQCTWYVARDNDGHTLGIGRYVSDFAKYACIYDLIIDEKYQGKGLGTAILNRIIADCIQHDIDTVHLWPTRGKVSFYTRFSFTPLGPDQPVMVLNKNAKG